MVSISFHLWFAHTGRSDKYKPNILSHQRRASPQRHFSLRSRTSQPEKVSATAQGLPSCVDRRSIVDSVVKTLCKLLPRLAHRATDAWRELLLRMFRQFELGTITECFDLDVLSTEQSSPDVYACGRAT